MKIIAAGGCPTDRNGRRRRPLSLRSIQMMMSLLAQILDDAVADRLRVDNPARSKRLRVRIPRPERTFLEIDQLVALRGAVGELEAPPPEPPRMYTATASPLHQAVPVRSPRDSALSAHDQPSRASSPPWDLLAADHSDQLVRECPPIRANSPPRAVHTAGGFYHRRLSRSMARAQEIQRYSQRF